MVRFGDGTCRLCTVVAWQRDGDAWRLLLQWGNYGAVYEGWYLHDAARVEAAAAPPGEPF